MLVDDERRSCSTVNFDTTALALAFEGLGLALSHMRRDRRVPHRQADVAWLLRTAAVPHAATAAAAYRLRHGAEDGGGARGRDPPPRLPARRHDGAGRRRRRGLRADDARASSSKTRDIVARLARLAAVELTVAAQAVDLRGSGIRLGAGTAAHAFVRARVAPLDDDRPMRARISSGWRKPSRPASCARAGRDGGMNWTIDNYDRCWSRSASTSSWSASRLALSLADRVPLGIASAGGRGRLCCRDGRSPACSTRCRRSRSSRC